MNKTRVVLGTTAIFAFVAAIVLLARWAAAEPLAAGGLAVSTLGAAAAIVAIGSLYEWIVHRFVYHAPSRIPLLEGIYQIHQRGHHWHRFPPDRYVETGPVERIPIALLDAPDPYALCKSAPRRWAAWGGQYALYMAVGIPFAFVPAWVLTGNALFTTSAVVSGVTVCYFFIRVHDVIHYPADRVIERFGWYRFLDRHHYIHHMDTKVNLNFLLPLADWLFGTLRRVPTAEEARRWPPFEEAKRPGSSLQPMDGGELAAITRPS
jgi:hypothetical protein